MVENIPLGVPGWITDYDMTYAEKLRDPRWQKKRLQILERDNWSCQSCHTTTKNLQVHHLYYAKRDPWDYPDEVYQTLCEDCHEVRQKIVDKVVEDIRVLAGSVPTDSLRQLLSNGRDVIQVGAEYFRWKNQSNGGGK